MKYLKVNIKEDLQKDLQVIYLNKLPGPDGIHPKTFKDTEPVISEPLQIVFN